MQLANWLIIAGLVLALVGFIVKVGSADSPKSDASNPSIPAMPQLPVTFDGEHRWQQEGSPILTIDTTDADWRRYRTKTLESRRNSEQYAAEMAQRFITDDDVRAVWAFENAFAIVLKSSRYEAPHRWNVIQTGVHNSYDMTPAMWEFIQTSWRRLK